MVVRFVRSPVRWPSFTNLINKMGVSMSVASLRNFRAIRTSMLLAAAPLALIAAPAGAADTAAAAAATNSNVHYGTWGVDLKSRDLKTNPGDDFER